MGTSSAFHQPKLTTVAGTCSRYTMEELVAAINCLEDRPRNPPPTERFEWPQNDDQSEKKSKPTGGVKIRINRKDRRRAKKIMRAEVTAIHRKVRPSMWTELQISLMNRYGRLVPTRLKYRRDLSLKPGQFLDERGTMEQFSYLT